MMNSQTNLTAATIRLTEEVVQLATAVSENNSRIDSLQIEIKRKPDDSELKFFMDENTRIRRYLITVVIIPCIVVAAILSGFTAYYVADRDSKQRCMNNKATSEKLVGILTSFKNNTNDVKIRNAIYILQHDRVNCK